MIFWHGSPSGEFKGHHYGIHVGTRKAAEQSLHARIGVPVEGSWDGTRAYGETLLMGKKSLQANGHSISGHNAKAPDHDYYPHQHSEKPSYSDRTEVPHHVKPSIFAVRLKGKMTNTPHRPHADFKANGYMKAALKRGNAKSGYFYKNEAEDVGSISAVVPGGDHLERLPHDSQHAEIVISGGNYGRHFRSKYR